MGKYTGNLFLTLLLGIAPFSLHAKQAVATFGMGCFWCAEQALDKVPGVLKTTSGYSGGHVLNPSYKQVTQGNTGHIEVVQVLYDDSVVTYQTLLKTFWRNVDPFTKDRQFCDRGYQYSAAIFAHNDKQRQVAQIQHKKIASLLGKNEVLIIDYTNFYPAESYHQNYYKRNPIRYNYYKHSCGREKRLDTLWSGIQFNQALP